MYVMECSLYKIQYVGKTKTPFNIGLNNHRSDLSNPNAISACLHFALDGYNFNIHTKFLSV